MIITRAAIMFQNGDILEGKSYGTITSLANRLGIHGEKYYGFMTSDGAFVDAAFAAFIAFQAKQILIEVDELVPEDLWSVGVEQ